MTASGDQLATTPALGLLKKGDSSCDGPKEPSGDDDSMFLSNCGRKRRKVSSVLFMMGKYRKERENRSGISGEARVISKLVAVVAATSRGSFPLWQR